MTTELRLRSKISEQELGSKIGKVLTEDDFDVLLTRSTRVLKPDGKPLAVYLPGVLESELLTQSYTTLHSLKQYETTNRGLASGTPRVAGGGTRSYSKSVPSAIVGAFDRLAPYTYCRLTAWTGKENEQFRGLYPLFKSIGDHFKREVPDRYEAQMAYIRRTDPSWVIEGTPFSTITVNNSYPTGVHTDKGDLDEGFSTLACLRYGDYGGGHLVFPEYRVAVDMHHGDVLLMDAHEWHGNVFLKDLTPTCDWGEEAAGWRFTGLQPGTQRTVTRHACDTHYNALKTTPSITLQERWPVVPMERISVVSYYRTKMAECGTPEQEAEKAAETAEQRSGLIDTMAREAAEVRA